MLEGSLQGRRWAQLEPHLEGMWVMTMRAMDDVKESCRAAAAITMHTLQSVTLRLADPAATASEDSTKAMHIMLPFLLSKCMPLSHFCFACTRVCAPSVQPPCIYLKAQNLRVAFSASGGRACLDFQNISRFCKQGPK